jgi:thiamine biosynthesis protein ThiS
MKVKINGNLKEIDSVRTLAELLDALGVPAKSVLIEQNGNVVARPDFQAAVVNDGDTIEIVQMVAGGWPNERQWTTANVNEGSAVVRCCSLSFVVVHCPVPRIAPETIEQVTAALNIVDVIGSYFPLRRAGTEFRALCPFHQEKTPSFYVSPDKQTF